MQTVLTQVRGQHKAHQGLCGKEPSQRTIYKIGLVSNLQVSLQFNFAIGSDNPAPF